MLKFFGFVFLVLIALSVYMGVQLYSLQKEALAYVQTTQPAIITHWDEQAFLAEAAPDLLKKYPRSQTDALFAYCSHLGNLKSAQPPKGSVTNMLSFLQGKSCQAVYITKASFDHGDANITLHLAKMGATWKILGFYVTNLVNPAQINPTTENPVSAIQQTSTGFHNPLDAPGHK